MFVFARPMVWRDLPGNIDARLDRDIGIAIGQFEKIDRVALEGFLPPNLLRKFARLLDGCGAGFDFGMPRSFRSASARAGPPSLRAGNFLTGHLISDGS